jgi:hypothetical protein
MKKVIDLQIGDKVSGEYFNIPFTGVVRDKEGSSLDWNYYNVYVTPDQPFEVYGVVRDGFMILANAKDRQFELRTN